MFGQSVASGNTIFWGDGTSTTPTNTSQALLNHTYAEKGKYDITVENTSGYFFFGQSSTTKGLIFQDGITDGYQARFEHYCTILKRVELGNGWKSDEGRQFNACKDLQEVYINTKPNQTSIAGNMFLNCISLTRVDGVSGWNNGITSIGNNAFSGCGLQKNIVFPNVTVLPTSYNAESTTGNAPLSEIELWEGLTKIGDSAFKNCQEVCEIIIPSTVTDIMANAFNSCLGLEKLHLKPTVPPTVSNANAFTLGTNNNYSPFKIYVPSASLTDYQSASIWSTWASYMVGE